MILGVVYGHRTLSEQDWPALLHYEEAGDIHRDHGGHRGRGGAGAQVRGDPWDPGARDGAHGGEGPQAATAPAGAGCVARASDMICCLLMIIYGLALHHNMNK